MVASTSLSQRALQWTAVAWAAIPVHLHISYAVVFERLGLSTLPRRASRLQELFEVEGLVAILREGVNLRLVRRHDALKLVLEVLPQHREVRNLKHTV